MIWNTYGEEDDCYMTKERTCWGVRSASLLVRHWFLDLSRAHTVLFPDFNDPVDRNILGPRLPCENRKLETNHCVIVCDSILKLGCKHPTYRSNSKFSDM